MGTIICIHSNTWHLRIHEFLHVLCNAGDAALCVLCHILRDFSRRRDNVRFPISVKRCESSEVPERWREYYNLHAHACLLVNIHVPIHMHESSEVPERRREYLIQHACMPFGNYTHFSIHMHVLRAKSSQTPAKRRMKHPLHMYTCFSCMPVHIYIYIWIFRVRGTHLYRSDDHEDSVTLYTNACFASVKHQHHWSKTDVCLCVCVYVM
jgi:hypothetical protein